MLLHVDRKTIEAENYWPEFVTVLPPSRPGAPTLTLRYPLERSVDLERWLADRAACAINDAQDVLAHSANVELLAESAQRASELASYVVRVAKAWNLADRLRSPRPYRLREAALDQWEEPRGQ